MVPPDAVRRLSRLMMALSGIVGLCKRQHDEATRGVPWRLLRVPPPTRESVADELREIAVGRLLFDNVPHVKAYWIMMGLETAQLCLGCGADDIDGTVVEEKITHMAGGKTPEGLSEEFLRDLIREAGKEPVRRDTLYRRVPSRFDAAETA